MNNASRLASVFVLSATLQACNSDPNMCHASDVDYERSIATRSVFSHFLPIWTGKMMVMIPQYRQERRSEAEKQVLRAQHVAICAGAPEASR